MVKYETADFWLEDIKTKYTSLDYVHRKSNKAIVSH